MDRARSVLTIALVIGASANLLMLGMIIARPYMDARYLANFDYVGMCEQQRARWVTDHLNPPKPFTASNGAVIYPLVSAISVECITPEFQRDHM